MKSFSTPRNHHRTDTTLTKPGQNRDKTRTKPGQKYCGLRHQWTGSSQPSWWSQPDPSSFSYSLIKDQYSQFNLVNKRVIKSVVSWLLSFWVGLFPEAVSRSHQPSRNIWLPRTPSPDLRFSFIAWLFYTVSAPQGNGIEMQDDPGVGVGAPQRDHHQAVFGDAPDTRYRRDGNGTWL